MIEDVYIRETKELILSVASRCRKCNYCYSVCPLYQSTRGFQIQGPSGILQAMAYAIKWGEVDGAEKNELRSILYACTTCNSCTLKCKASCTGIPVLTAIEKGRAYLIEKMVGPVPEQKKVLESLMLKGNSYDLPPGKRLDWLTSLEEKNQLKCRRLPDGKPVDVLLFVGCTASYNDDVQDVARAMVTLLEKMGFDYGILKEEKCCGSPARRMGEEGLFEELSEYMVEMADVIKPGQIVTLSPHCYNTFISEYPEAVGRYHVRHYTQFLAEVTEQHPEWVSRGIGARLTYHDPCYLSKQNSVTEAPRRVIEKMADKEEFAEMFHHGEDSLCCGGGGGRIFWDPEETHRLSETRVREAMDTGAAILVTACPWCKIELEDAIKTMDVEEDIAVKDLAVLMSERLSSPDK